MTPGHPFRRGPADVDTTAVPGRPSAMNRSLFRLAGLSADELDRIAGDEREPRRLRGLAARMLRWRGIDAAPGPSRPAISGPTWSRADWERARAAWAEQAPEIPEELARTPRNDLAKPKTFDRDLRYFLYLPGTSAVVFGAVWGWAGAAIAAGLLVVSVGVYLALARTENADVVRFLRRGPVVHGVLVHVTRSVSPQGAVRFICYWYTRLGDAELIATSGHEPKRRPDVAPFGCALLYLSPSNYLRALPRETADLMLGTKR